MIPLQTFATGVMAEVIRRQPSSPARTAFAWQLAAGTALARGCTVELQDRVLRVRARDPRWAREIQRAAETLLPRMQQLLGGHAVERIEVAGGQDGDARGNVHA